MKREKRAQGIYKVGVPIRHYYEVKKYEKAMAQNSPMPSRRRWRGRIGLDVAITKCWRGRRNEV